MVDLHPFPLQSARSPHSHPHSYSIARSLMRSHASWTNQGFSRCPTTPAHGPRKDAKKNRPGCCRSHSSIDPRPGEQANGDLNIELPVSMRWEPALCVQAMACIAKGFEPSVLLCAFACPSGLDRSHWNGNALCPPYRPCATPIIDFQGGIQGDLIMPVEGVSNPSQYPMQHPVHPVHSV